jgi:Tol biopolymer transport system component
VSRADSVIAPFALLAFVLAGCGGGQLVGEVSDLGSGPFQEVQLIRELSDDQAGDESPTLRGDELEIIFESSRSGSDDLWTSTRSSLSEPWRSPSLVTAASTSLDERDPALSWDGLTLWFVREQEAAPSLVWVTTRRTLQAEWAAPVVVDELTALVNLRAPAVSEDGLSMALCHEPGPQGGADLMLSTRAGRDAAWELATPIAEAITSSNDWDPFLSYDALSLFWATDTREIVTATRRSPGSRFGPSQTVEGLGSAVFDPTLSRDLRRILFASDRAGTADLYQASR